MSAPLITFLSDYGLADEFVGVCHGVIARRCPDARVLDVTHTIPRGDVRAGALVLRDALAYMPVGVHLAIVDPTVGARERRAVALRAGGEGRLLVGPDNGLLWLAAERLGGVVEALDIGRSRERLEPVSATFHGRDVFAPVAAALATGVPLASVGEPFAAATLVRLELTRAHVERGRLLAHAMRVDGFGNVALDASGADVDAAGLRTGAAVSVGVCGRTYQGRRVEAFADVAPGELLLYVDATGAAALAVNLGSAAHELALRPGEQVTLAAT